MLHIIISYTIISTYTICEFQIYKYLIRHIYFKVYRGENTGRLYLYTVPGTVYIYYYV